MSSRPGLFLEDYLAWQFDLVVETQEEANASLRIAEMIGTVPLRPRISKEAFQEIVQIYEPHRASIEHLLQEFDEETQSWRDYAGYAFCEPKHLAQAARKRLKELGTGEGQRTVKVIENPAAPLEGLCLVCQSKYLGVGDDPWNGKPRCACNYHPLAGDLVWRDAEGTERRMRAGPVTPPPGYLPPFRLAWTGIRCLACGLWKADLDDVATRKLIWRSETPPSMAPSDRCVCP